MGLQQIDMPDHFPLDSIDPEADRLIELANEQKERFMSSDQKVMGTTSAVISISPSVLFSGFTTIICLQLTGLRTW